MTSSSLHIFFNPVILIFLKTVIPSQLLLCGTFDFILFSAVFILLLCKTRVKVAVLLQ